MKKFLLFVASEKGYTALRRLHDEDYKNVACVITFEEVLVDHDWSYDIMMLCREQSIPCFFWKEAKNKLYEIISKYNVTSAVTIAWKYLIQLDINKYLEDNLIVFHDSLLPKYRGFSPTPTAIICGEQVIGVTAIFATDQTDRGDIILQKEVSIPDNMYIKEIIELQSRLCGEMLTEIIDLAINHELLAHAHAQNEDEATYSIWRNEEDCHIDWKWSNTYIFNFIRALGSPYHGAYTYLDGKMIIVRKAKKLDYDYQFAIRQPGKIWSIREGVPVVICGKGLLQIEEAESINGERIMFDKVRRQLK